MKSVEKDIIIVGGGPVGLYLAARLLQNGISCTVLERNNSIDLHSKSLGIHPVSLELFEKAGVVDSFIEHGLKIQKGIAFWNRKIIGEITFEKCPKPFNYILALPQWKTEEILQGWVDSLDDTSIVRNAEVTDIKHEKNSVTVTYHQGKDEFLVNSKFVVGCDGKNSYVRKALDISSDRKSYPDTYIMGDFTDNTNFGKDAAIYLHKKGLIETFPLPNGLRRWVVKTDFRIDNPEKDLLVSLVHNRIQLSLSETENFMMSSFGVEHFLTERLYAGRVLLAGDSAHVVSPIGGQGMNLGWIGAEFCFLTLRKAINHPNIYKDLFEVYSKKQKEIARQVALRAEMNMWLGRSENSGRLIEIATRILVGSSFSHILAKVFTMRGLGKWWY